MGIGDTIIGAVKDAAGFNNEGNNSDKPASQQFESFYKTVPENWYKARPYAFEFTPRTGKPIIMYLPISPSNLTITTHFATNIVSTLYGVVEEHSEVRYYDIVIAGTTGYAPRFPVPRPLEKRTEAVGRESFATDGNNLTETATSFIKQSGGALGAALGKVADAVTGEDPNTSGIDLSESGYEAFHNLYRFFLAYKKDASGIGFKAGSFSNKSGKSGGFANTVNKAASAVSKVAGGGGKESTSKKGHPLTFKNYKDGNQYDVVPQTFTLTRSAENPMLYNYNIKLRAYNLKAVNGTVSDNIDFLSNLGLTNDNGESLTSSGNFGKAKEGGNNAKGLAGTVGKALKSFG